MQGGVWHQLDFFSFNSLDLHFVVVACLFSLLACLPEKDQTVNFLEKDKNAFVVYNKYFLPYIF
jgi:hypothetical protein